MCENCGCGHNHSTITGPEGHEHGHTHEHSHEHSHAHSHDADGTCCSHSGTSGRDLSKNCCEDRKYCCEKVDNPPVPSKHQTEKRVIRCSPIRAQAGEDD